jgi:serine/threonine protein kinase
LPPGRRETQGEGCAVPQATPFTREVGAEPIPGYRLIEPLGQGGFGEVWKCEAPGGLYKAIKIVGHGSAGSSPAEQELAALQRVKTIRHPFILSLERVEVIDKVLLIIMELADRSLHHVHAEYRARGEEGIPRAELLSYLLEAAEALDWMNFEHGLQHLDIKPHNLFLVTNHLKVADFGLVHSLGDAAGGGTSQRNGGVTPLYASPEILRGMLSRHSDQYSLAIVYQQMLTGVMPFWNDNVHDLINQQLSAQPDLSSLPICDRPIVAQALCKLPDDRFPSCQEFLQALLTVHPAPTSLRSSGMWRRVLLPPRDPSKTPIPAAPVKPSHRSAGSSEGSSTRLVTPGSPAPGAEMTRPTPTTARANDTPRPRVGTEGSLGAPLGQPTSVSLPGYRFKRCLAQGPLGDLWRAVADDGRERRALCLLSFVRYDEQLIAHLRALRHPALPPTEVYWSPAERMVLMTDRYEQTLRERFEACQASGQPGILRAELLGYLRTAAEALDTLAEEHGLQHLGLNPKNLLLQQERLWIADFGVIPLVWLPTRQFAGPLNNRYAAPELFGSSESSTADQYSLALIFAEMLSGSHPRSQRASGLHGRPALNGARTPAMNRPPRIDLDLLPVRDRRVLARALDADPDKRFPNCRALIDALEKAGASAEEPEDLYQSLPPVIPFASLLGEPAAPDTLLPTVPQLVKALIALPEERLTRSGGDATEGQPVGIWEYRCPIQLFPGAMQLKVEGFCEQWNARIVRREGDSYKFQVDLQAPRRFWERLRSQPRWLEVDLEVEAPSGARSRLTQAHVRIRPRGGEPAVMARIAATLAPQLFDSLRSYLQATQEQRAQERWPFEQPVRVYPVLPDLELAEVIGGVGKNISLRGVSFRVPTLPPTDQLYLHFHEAAGAVEYAILAQVMHSQPAGNEGFEIGAMFPGGG